MTLFQPSRAPGVQNLHVSYLGPRPSSIVTIYFLGFLWYTAVLTLTYYANSIKQTRHIL